MTTKTKMMRVWKMERIEREGMRKLLPLMEVAMATPRVRARTRRGKMIHLRHLRLRNSLGGKALDQAHDGVTCVIYLALELSVQACCRHRAYFFFLAPCYLLDFFISVCRHRVGVEPFWHEGGYGPSMPVLDNWLLGSLRPIMFSLGVSKKKLKLTVVGVLRAIF